MGNQDFYKLLRSKSIQDLNKILSECENGDMELEQEDIQLIRKEINSRQTSDSESHPLKKANLKNDLSNNLEKSDVTFEQEKISSTKKYSTKLPVEKTNSNKTSETENTNKVVNVRLIGGIIGLLGDSPQNSLNRKIKKENLKGYRVVQIIPSESGNILLYLIRFVMLLCTLFFYTTANGFYVIMEKKK